MLVLALDTTTRAGSVALARDGALLDVAVGDPTRTHATRLPGDLVASLSRHGLTLADVDLFAVAAGPGSFTGLRIGIATIQGLAFAHARHVVAVSALDALAYAALGARQSHPVTLVGAWMDAQRQEVYAELYRPLPGQAEGANAVPGTSLDVVEPAAVGDPTVIVEAWQGVVAGQRGGVLLVGDGAMAYREIARAGLPGASFLEPVPPLAPAIAEIAGRQAELGLAVAPHAVKPVYVRRPDAELARERARAAAQGQAQANPSIPHE